MALKVESAPGPRGEPEPTVVWFGGRRVGVRAVVDRWFGTMQRWYRVDADDGQLYVLRHDLASHDWELAALTLRETPDDAMRVLHARRATSRPS
jgi:hypothetical protein